MKIKLLLVLCIIVCSCKNIDEDEGVRLKENINREWKFTFSSESDDFSSKIEGLEWERVGLPHSFSIPYFRSESFTKAMGGIKKHLKFIKLYSKKKQIDNAAPPILIFHGTEDKTVKFSKAKNLIAAYESVGVSYKLYPLEGYGHAAWLVTVHGKTLTELTYEYLIAQQKLTVVLCGVTHNVSLLN